MLDLSLPATDVAPMLLGAVIRHGDVAVRISEVEAYMGPLDPASHAFRGPGGRAAVMFGPPGHLYVYLSYGIHHCLNVVCSPDGVASAVLLRGGEVIAGAEIVQQRRGLRVPSRRLASGPGNLGRALGAELSDSGALLTLGSQPLRPAAELWSLEPAETPAPWAATTRIGISKNADAPWRFIIPSDPTVSGRRH